MALNKAWQGAAIGLIGSILSCGLAASRSSRSIAPFMGDLVVMGLILVCAGGLCGMFYEMILSSWLVNSFRLRRINGAVLFLRSFRDEIVGGSHPALVALSNIGAVTAGMLTLPIARSDMQPRHAEFQASLVGPIQDVLQRGMVVLQNEKCPAPRGVLAIYVGTEKWRTAFEMLLPRVSTVLISVNATRGLAWEIERVRQVDPINIFLITEPNATYDWSAVNHTFTSAGWRSLPADPGPGALLGLDADRNYVVLGKDLLTGHDYALRAGAWKKACADSMSETKTS